MYLLLYNYWYFLLDLDKDLSYSLNSSMKNQSPVHSKKSVGVGIWKNRSCWTLFLNRLARGSGAQSWKGLAGSDSQAARRAQSDQQPQHAAAVGPGLHLTCVSRPR